MTDNRVVYGPSEQSGPEDLVFVPEDLAEDLARLWEALNSSATWGDLRARIGDDRSREIDALLHDAELARPADEDPFDVTLVPSLGDGDFPEWPVAHQEAWMPAPVVERFGRREPTALQGDVTTFSADAEHDIVAALQEAGFTVRRDDDLVARASGLESD